jgi:hypothetical protein
MRLEFQVLTPLPFGRLSPSVLVGVFGMPSKFDTDALTVDGGGLFLHVVKLKRNPDNLRGRG